MTDGCSATRSRACSGRTLKTADAAVTARNLDDEALRAYLQQVVQPLVATINTVELRPIYDRTLQRAFRQENNPRQMIPKVKGRDRQTLGWSLPVARNDDSAVFTGDRAVDKRDVVVLLDDQLAA
jgi:hypothetical protein